MFYIDDFILDSPYYIFIKDSSSSGVASTIKKLNLNCHEITHKEEQKDEYANDIFYATLQEDWVHILDSYSYHLWHNTKLRDHLLAIGKTVEELFFGSAGDADHSFDFTYFKGGELVRKYVVEDPTYQKGIVTVNIGKPLDGEAEALLQEDERDKVLEMARLFGIKLRHQRDEIICYRSASL